MNQHARARCWMAWGEAVGSVHPTCPNRRKEMTYMKSI